MILCFVFSSRRRHTRCALVTGVQTCALPILLDIDDARTRIEADREAAQARLTRYIAENEPVAQGAAPLADVDLIELRRTWESKDRKSVVEGKSVTVCVDLGGRSYIKKKIKHNEH